MGCCRPPSYCGYDLMNSTFWPVVRTSMHNSEFNDCRTWKNEPNVMCYDCDSCKAGFLARIRNDWMKITTVINFLIAYLIINFLIGCCAFRSSVIADQRYRDYSWTWFSIWFVHNFVLPFQWILQFCPRIF